MCSNAALVVRAIVAPSKQQNKNQVLACVNRTMLDIRTRLRSEWRLHPLTPGALAKATLEFLKWGRRVTDGLIAGCDSSSTYLAKFFSDGSASPKEGSSQPVVPLIYAVCVFKRYLIFVFRCLYPK